MINRLIIPIFAAVVTGFAGYAAAVYQVSNRPVEVTYEVPKSDTEKILKQINERLDNMEKANTINIEKLKGFKGTFSVEQHYHMEVNTDSLFREKLIADIEGTLSKLKLSRCK